MSERMTKEERVRAAVAVRQAMLGERTMPDDAHTALTAILDDADAVRAEESRLLEVVKKQEEQLRAFTLAAMPLARFVEAFNRQPLAQVRAANILYGIHGGDTCWPVGADVKLSDLDALAAAYAKAVSP